MELVVVSHDVIITTRRGFNVQPSSVLPTLGSSTDGNAYDFARKLAVCVSTTQCNTRPDDTNTLVVVQVANFGRIHDIAVVRIVRHRARLIQMFAAPRTAVGGAARMGVEEVTRMAVVRSQTSYLKRDILLVY
jgi:hypothetical protein